MRLSPIKTDLPRVVILGRPNTGKSTLFNRLLKKRRSITDPEPGVTRDTIEEECIIHGHWMTLIDTGGFSLDRDEMPSLVRNKTLSLLKEATIILFVIDVNLLVKEDKEFIQHLHPYRDKIILVVNKMDNAGKDPLFYETYALGFSRTIGISAEHGGNMLELVREMGAMLDSQSGEKRTARPAADIKLALLGKPNTGKSTLLNCILNEERALVSAIPGTTRDVIEGSFAFKQKTFTILDTAGIRRKSKIERPVEYYSVNRAIKAIDDSDIIVLLIDAIEGLCEQDKRIAGLALRKGKGLLLCINKWDLVEKIPNQLRAMKDRIEFMFPVAVTLPIIPISSKTGEGIEKMLLLVMRIYVELQKRIETGELNRALGGWTKKFNIPIKKRIKIRYMTQVGIHPIRFVLFVNARRGFPLSYLNYLKNCLREDFGFGHVPIQIEIRVTSKKQQ